MHNKILCYQQLSAIYINKFIEALRNILLKSFVISVAIVNRVKRCVFPPILLCIIFFQIQRC